ncbi:9650_t:CDS:2 [Ambispora gerdemannii]|uniref:9650_t:CDS:1 n=1 Tax=Ambispora gerdemannii TaxID=144530 RepID=A0A9N9A6G7_9GLOM|nr:9650_t:CDS:2 [Ambispora gerdemannii]
MSDNSEISSTFSPWSNLNYPSNTQSTGESETTLEQEQSYNEHLVRKYNTQVKNDSNPKTIAASFATTTNYAIHSSQMKSPVTWGMANASINAQPSQQASHQPFTHDGNIPRSEMDKNKKDNDDDEQSSSTEQRSNESANQINDPSQVPSQDKINNVKTLKRSSPENSSREREILQDNTEAMKTDIEQNSSDEKNQGTITKKLKEACQYVGDMVSESIYQFYSDIVPEQVFNKLTDPLLNQQPKQSFHSVALFIFFNVDYTHILPAKEEFTRYGLTYLIEIFKCGTHNQTTNAINTAKELTLDCAINCWRNKKNFTLFIATDTQGYIVSEFIKSIRKICDRETLHAIVIRPDASRFWVRDLDRAGATYVVCNKSKHVAIEMMKFLEAYEKKGRGGQKVDFYNKDEPYYEFTNFYRAKVNIDKHSWPTTEHYFQAQKFENLSIQKKIRNAYTAREAFSIARDKNDEKRTNWESPTSPDGIIFKEKVMEHAQMCKYTQYPQLKYKLLSTATADLYEHTSNDNYWGDGGNDRRGQNRLGCILTNVRSTLMNQEINKLAIKHKCSAQQTWIVPQLLKRINEWDRSQPTSNKI